MRIVTFLVYCLAIFGSLFFKEANGRGGAGGGTRTSDDGPVQSYNVGAYLGIIGAIIFLGIAGCCLYFIFCYKRKEPRQTFFYQQYKGGLGKPTAQTQSMPHTNQSELKQLKGQSVDEYTDPQCAADTIIWTTPTLVNMRASEQIVGAHHNIHSTVHGNLNVKINGHNKATSTANSGKRALPYL